jgi:hypothetical protein
MLQTLITCFNPYIICAEVEFWSLDCVLPKLLLKVPDFFCPNKRISTGDPSTNAWLLVPPWVPSKVAPPVFLVGEVYPVDPGASPTYLAFFSYSIVFLERSFPRMSSSLVFPF